LPEGPVLIRGASARRWGLQLITAALLGLLLNAPVAAQTIRGWLVDAASGEPIPGARVALLLASDGRVV